MANDLTIFDFDNSYATELEGFYTPWQGLAFPNPQIIALNRDLASELQVNLKGHDNETLADVFSGKVSPTGAAPLAMAYAGHQFGGFSPQLGDGRAMLLGEVIDAHGARRDIHLKGSGRTPFSRGGDGKAVIGPVLREYLIGEAMYALGIPTTRALAAVTTGEQVTRDGPQPGAVLARVASSHLRVGTFQFFAARREVEKLKILADYAIERHFPQIANASNKYLMFLKCVRDKQAELISRWMQVGFVHGVMNTDNMTISCETIDYGPCAFIDSYDPAAVYSSIDQHGRYAFGNQPNIAQWNLARLAETLLGLINPDDTEDAIRLATNEINAFSDIYQSHWLMGMQAKLGFEETDPDDFALVQDLLDLMAEDSVDFTNLFRNLSRYEPSTNKTVAKMFNQGAAIAAWLARYDRRLTKEAQSHSARQSRMLAINPAYIARNHMVEAALSAAAIGEMKPFEDLARVLREPFTEKEGQAQYALPAPDGFGPYKTFCGT